MTRQQLILTLILLICIIVFFVCQYNQSPLKMSPSSYLIFNHTVFLSRCNGMTNTTFTAVSDPLISAEEWESLVKNLMWPLPPKAFSSTEATDVTKCSFSIVNPDSNHTVGGFVDVTIKARDAQAQDKTYGGDFFQAKLYNMELKASTYGAVTDHCNGTYTVRLALLWPGPAKVSIRLVHSSEAVQVLCRQREQDPDKVYFLGHFTEGDKQETAICNAQRSSRLVGDSKQCCCEYKDPYTEEYWWCRRPPSLPCQTLTYHSMGGYQAVLSESEKTLLKRKFWCNQTSLVLEVYYDVWELGTSDVLGSVHHPFQGLLVDHRAYAKPHCDTVRQNAPICAAVEVHKDLGRRSCTFVTRVEVLRVQERSSEMWKPRNLKLDTCSI
ncbi:NXPE family member 4-like [Esox lucius]|uniref:NXPE family member 4-like n=1 Tax=Esox lucius TaxID=8010 RepID=UPI001477441D|nr:NXPE family member 4-like [Esox lucius]